MTLPAPSPALELLRAAALFERSLARLEAAIDASPELEHAWFRRATLSEACRSTAMENFVTSETHLVLGLAGLGEPAADAAGDQLAARLWELYGRLPAPELLFEPESVDALRLRTTHQVMVVRRQALVVQDPAGPSSAVVEAVQTRFEELRTLPPAIALPFAVSTWHSFIRLQASHHVACRAAVPVISQWLGLSRRPVVLPALGFSHPRFVPWDPQPTMHWAARFLSLTAAAMAREADRFADLRRLAGRVEKALSPGGLGRNSTPVKQRIAGLVLTEPYLTGALLARKAGCSQATARQWLTALERHRILVPLPLRRSSARILVSTPLDPPVRPGDVRVAEAQQQATKRAPLSASRIDLPPSDLAKLDRDFASITSALTALTNRIKATVDRATIVASEDRSESSEDPDTRISG